MVKTFWQKDFIGHDWILWLVRPVGDYNNPFPVPLNVKLARMRFIKKK